MTGTNLGNTEFRLYFSRPAITCSGEMTECLKEGYGYEF